jgi:FixJ family two-component response regulator
MQLPLPTSDLPVPDEWRQAPEADAERKRLARLADKQERYTQVKDLLSRGLSAKEIAQQLAMEVANGLSLARTRRVSGAPVSTPQTP